MTLIMRVKEERWIKPVCTGPSLSTGAAPILFQTEVTVTPTEGWRGWRVGWSDRRTGPFQRLFGLTMGCFCLAKLCACVCGCDGVQGRGRNSCYLMEPQTHTHTHSSLLSLCALTLHWPEPVSGSPVHRGSPHPAVNSSLSVQPYTVPLWLQKYQTIS